MDRSSSASFMSDGQMQCFSEFKHRGKNLLLDFSSITFYHDNYHRHFAMPSTLKPWFSKHLKTINQLKFDFNFNSVVHIKDKLGDRQYYLLKLSQLLLKLWRYFHPAAINIKYLWYNKQCQHLIVALRNDYMLLKQNMEATHLPSDPRNKGIR